MAPAGLLVPSLTMPPMSYTDTRGLANGHPNEGRAGGAAAKGAPAFTDVLIKGLAPGGGLFVPESVPALALEEILALAGLPYATRAARIFAKWKLDLPAETVETLLAEAYGNNFDLPEVAPLREVRPGMHVLELWHGPTAAFKDMALQCMPLFFGGGARTRAERGASTDDYLILVATSGDTGKAALEGFADREHTRIVVFYPAKGVSDIQRKQMVTQDGDNVAVFGVRGNFDDCQTAVKAAFDDQAFNAELLRGARLRLSSANSINWGRLLPADRLLRRALTPTWSPRGGVTPAKPMDVCVPPATSATSWPRITPSAWACRSPGSSVRSQREQGARRLHRETGIYDLTGRRLRQHTLARRWTS